MNPEPNQNQLTTGVPKTLADCRGCPHRLVTPLFHPNSTAAYFRHTCRHPAHRMPRELATLAGPDGLTLWTDCPDQRGDVDHLLWRVTAQLETLVAAAEAPPAAGGQT